MEFLKIKLHHPIIIVLFYLAKFFIKLLPLNFLPFLGSQLGKYSFLILKSKRNLVYENLKIAFPHWDKEKLKKCVLENFKHYGITFLELFKTENLLNKIEIEGIENLKEKPSILITGHIGNWELMAQALGKNGVPLFALAKKSYLNVFTKFLINLRKKGNVETILRSENDSPKKLLKAIREGKVLGFLIDQDTKVDGIFVDFFGRPAYTPKGPVEIALKKNIPLNFGYLVRKGNLKYYLKVERIDNISLNLEEILRIINKKFENIIKAHPTQWVWVHKRWKTKPIN